MMGGGAAGSTALLPPSFTARNLIRNGIKFEDKYQAWDAMSSAIMMSGQGSETVMCGSSPPAIP
jgi:hypothetical protein